MKAEGVHLLFWLLGTVGVAGTIALFLAAPSAFSIALKAVVAFLNLAISYRIGCAALALVAGLLIADYWRAGKDAAEWKRRTAEFEQKQRDRDTRIATETEAEVRKELAEATANNITIDEDVKEFHDALPPVPTTGNPFIVGDASCRLRKIAGYAGCGPDGTKGVQKARPEGAGPRLIDRSGFRLPGSIAAGPGGAAKGQ